MSLDTPLRKVAQTVLKRFGTDVTFRRVTGAAYNTSTGTMTPTTADTTVKARIDEYTDRELGFSVATQTAPPVRAGDRKVTVAAADLSYTPTVDDRVVIATLVYDIIRVQPQLATDLAAIHIVQVRR